MLQKHEDSLEATVCFNLVGKPKIS